jgi:23S rRNA (adenine2030-N6)-methyltransferase
MFSYRHAFHAGNHADVLKHLTLVSVVGHLTQKDVPILAVDTHAGAGVYDLEQRQAQTSGEALSGIARLRERLAEVGAPSPALADYLQALTAANPSGRQRLYPGSPWLLQHLLREQDQLRLFEMHPTDWRVLGQHVKEWAGARRVRLDHADGFEGLPPLMPPPSRRGLVIMDPSYEIKTDYARVITSLEACLKRFATGVYLVWYPIIARPQSQQLPKQLTKLALAAGKPWLLASLRVQSGGKGTPQRPGVVNPRSLGPLSASGVFVVNPPHTLHERLKAALPQLVKAMGQDHFAGFTLHQG